jgi:hypothetical protein
VENAASGGGNMKPEKGKMEMAVRQCAKQDKSTIICV